MFSNAKVSGGLSPARIVVVPVRGAGDAGEGRPVPPVQIGEVANVTFFKLPFPDDAQDIVILVSVIVPLVLFAMVIGTSFLLTTPQLKLISVQGSGGGVVGVSVGVGVGVSVGVLVGGGGMVVAGVTGVLVGGVTDVLVGVLVGVDVLAGVTGVFVGPPGVLVGPPGVLVGAGVQVGSPGL